MPKVVVYDCIDSIRELISTLIKNGFKDHDIEVELHATTDGLLEAAANADLIIHDVFGRDTHGAESEDAKSLRALAQRYPDKPIIIISTAKLHDSLVQLAESKGYPFVQKPNIIKPLQDHIRTKLHLK